jgi:hypothetical protein
VAHDRDPRDLEVGGDVAGDPRSLAQEVEDPAPRRIGQGEPNGAAVKVVVRLQIAGRTG